MHDVVFGEYFERLDYLMEITQRSVFRQSSIFFQDVFEGATVTELIDKVEVINGFEHIKVSYDIGAGLKIAEYVDFIDRSFLQFG